jgi:hypothetical protein
MPCGARRLLVGYYSSPLQLCKFKLFSQITLKFM